MSHQNNSDPLSNENLQIVQKENLEFLEDVLGRTLKVKKIPILQVLNYDFIQILNNMYLREVIPDEELNEEIKEEKVIQ